MRSEDGENDDSKDDGRCYYFLYVWRRKKSTAFRFRFTRAALCDDKFKAWVDDPSCACSPQGWTYDPWIIVQHDCDEVMFTSADDDYEQVFDDGNGLYTIVCRAAKAWGCDGTTDV